MKFYVTDGNAGIVIEADSPAEAAQEFVDTGDWGEIESTDWIHVHVTPCDEDGTIKGERERITVTLEPEEPACTHDDGHDWQTPEWLGGCSENPGVWGHGGGVQGTYVCGRCGRYKDWDTWAQDPCTGQQGLNSVSYREPDDASLEWVAEKDGCV